MDRFNQFTPIASAICALLHPHAEVVIHDLKSGKIAALFNNFSKRKVGAESLLDEFDENEAFPVYSKTNWDGKLIKSTSAILRDEKNNPIGLLCINLDLSKWQEMQHFLDQWMQGFQKQPDSLFKDDWREKINSYVTQFLLQENTTLKSLSKDKKRDLVLALHREGAFNAKNSAAYVADVLELSRATIYNYLRT